LLAEQSLNLALARADLDERARYIAYLEATVAIKDAHIHDLVGLLRQREAELVRARTPRWPWAKVKGKR
jgi:hypothetical protein